MILGVDRRRSGAARQGLGVPGARSGPSGLELHFPASDHSEPIELDPFTLFVKIKIHF